jgi:hypothetical protein
MKLLKKQNQNSVRFSKIIYLDIKKGFKYDETIRKEPKFDKNELKDFDTYDIVDTISIEDINKVNDKLTDEINNQQVVVDNDVSILDSTSNYQSPYILLSNLRNSKDYTANAIQIEAMITENYPEITQALYSVPGVDFAHQLQNYLKVSADGKLGSNSINMLEQKINEIDNQRENTLDEMDKWVSDHSKNTAFQRMQDKKKIVHSIVRNQSITGSNINYHSSEFDNGNVNSVTLDGVNATNSTFGISIID